MTSGDRPFRWRLWLALLAAVLTAVAIAHPRVPFERNVFRYFFVIDITQSMNVRDYHVTGQPADRLGFVKQTLAEALFELPCGSEVGLGLFTTRNAELLFEPLEICEHLPIITDVLSHIDWRMAWAADSYIATGLYNALRQVGQRKPATRLVFLSDGQQTPDEAITPPFMGKAGEVKGVVVGVGGSQPMLVPKLDRENRQTGYWENADLTAPEDRTPTQQFEAQAIPETPPSGFYLSRLHEDHLKRLAASTGLDYLRLNSAEDLRHALRSDHYAEPQRVQVDLAPLLAGLAWLLLIASYWHTPRLRRPAVAR
ncbi:vWA domain-containing protein [Methylotetracoccus oryzae]|uniref:vWA domain-containing protein n=1 Tax=Methylotetracoccus oryzae TaxID=1919059 RepID=UPI001119BAED|nr:vWA domain-containing protein [Methylotetracoccus oryzae]